MSAQTAPRDSGLSRSVSTKADTLQISKLYISGFFNFDISRPFKPASMNTGPSQRIMLYEEANAIPLKASEAITGSPSPWNVLATTPTHARERAERLSASVLESKFMVSQPASDGWHARGES